MRTPAKSQPSASPLRTTATLLIAVVISFVPLLVGCGGDGSGASTEGGAGGSTATAGPSTSESTVATEATSTETVVEAPCSPGDFLPVLEKAFDGVAPKLRVVKAKVERCRNGYAQVFAVPDMSVCDPGVGYCYETEQVFLGWRSDRWRILTSGTGISCGAGTETIPLIIRICRGLGYPDLTTASFQMPSRNVGCLLAGGILRCDILSGLVPEPGATCNFDWVGLVLPQDGAAEPNCGSDTVYDGAAPTLAYGGTWRRAGFACESRQSGLSCSNRAGHRFALARGGWTAS